MFMCWRGRIWCQPTIVRKPFRFATGFDPLPSTMPMAVNSVHSAAIKGRPSGRPFAFGNCDSGRQNSQPWS
jgi:hypothetical protein